MDQEIYDKEALFKEPVQKETVKYDISTQENPNFDLSHVTSGDSLGNCHTNHPLITPNQPSSHDASSSSQIHKNLRDKTLNHCRSESNNIFSSDHSNLTSKSDHHRASPLILKKRNLPIDQPFSPLQQTISSIEPNTQSINTIKRKKTNTMQHKNTRVSSDLNDISDKDTNKHTFPRKELNDSIIKMKKESHRQIEKKRRDNITNAILNLRGHLPDHFSKSNKCQIIKSAVEYIRILEDELRNLKRNILPSLGDPALTGEGHHRELAINGRETSFNMSLNYQADEQSNETEKPSMNQDEEVDGRTSETFGNRNSIGNLHGKMQDNENDVALDEQGQEERGLLYLINQQNSTSMLIQTENQQNCQYWKEDVNEDPN